eukprot:9397298-Pyramimonas_sp.AAC.1
MSRCTLHRRARAPSMPSAVGPRIFVLLGPACPACARLRLPSFPCRLCHKGESSQNTQTTVDA